VNPSTLQGAAALVFACVVAVWVYLLRTNISRWLRWPLAGIAVLAGYTMSKLNDQIMSHDRLPADLVKWWENSALLIVTVLLFVLPAMHALHERGEKRCARATKGSRAQMNVQR
jgi:hypothetical protein